ncbi:putative PhzF superfamily epimerase YddE/YHI9 [Nocardiopsis metallicus]|uniref:Putative PhzF superfamily epimerase YddE/YHI9 n=1 Tax=Nocardiopsis metallicus TaxID=179819 RepID=A0A840WPN5_9ACTN|nr:putative PhzF superfamily epimerase YddE/YHI9 [Nocardiopsis metallicus]
MIFAEKTSLERRGRIRVSSDRGKIWIGGRAEIVLSGSAVL